MITQRQVYDDGNGNAIFGVMRYSEINYQLIDVNYFTEANVPYYGDLFNVNSAVLDSNSKPLWVVTTISGLNVFYDITGAEYNGAIILGSGVVTPVDPDTLYGEGVTGVAGYDITMVASGTAFMISWNNTDHTEGWTQAGNVLTLVDGSELSGGEKIKILYKKP